MHKLNFYHQTTLLKNSFLAQLFSPFSLCCAESSPVCRQPMPPKKNEYREVSIKMTQMKAQRKLLAGNDGVKQQERQVGETDRENTTNNSADIGKKM